MKRVVSRILRISVDLILLTGLAPHELSTLPRKKYSTKREHRRMNLNAHALIKHDEKEFSGELINFSDTGAYLTTSVLFSVNDPLELTIYFQHGTNKLSMTFPCKVARIEAKGVGLTSPHIDANMLQHLELIFDVSKDNTKQLIEEFIKAI